MTGMEIYDLNAARSGDTVHVVELVFMAFQYRKTEIRRVPGNCRGLANFQAAVSQVYDDLPEDTLENVYMVLEDDHGRTCTVADDDGAGEGFLRNLLVSARCIGIEATAH